MTDFQSKEVAEKFATYPPLIKTRLLDLRQLVFEAASQLGLESDIEESLKWGEPSYRTKYGSTLRIDWKASTPGQYFMFFHCQTKLIDTFKELHRDKFEFDGNRAIIFFENENVSRVLKVHEVPPRDHRS